MFKKEITYKDFNGDTRTEDFYFNFTPAELIEKEWGTSGGFSEWINRIVKTQDVPKLIAIFKDIILSAYGEKSPDGRRFMKSPEISKAFSETNAYSVLFTELVSNTEAAVQFMNALAPSEDDIPDNVRKEMQKTSIAAVPENK